MSQTPQEFADGEPTDDVRPPSRCVTCGKPSGAAMCKACAVPDDKENTL